MNRTTRKDQPILNPICSRWFIGGALALSLCASCAKDKPKQAEPAAKPVAAAPMVPGLPSNVDGRLFAQLTDVSKACQIDLRESKVLCENRQLEALTDQIVQGARSQSKSLDTVAYALAQADPKLSTVAAEFLYQAFRTPLDEKDVPAPSKATVLALIQTLSKLPNQQAVDAAPATVQGAMQTGSEKELYAAIDNHPYKRLPERAYRYLMQKGGMLGWPKVQELIKSETLELDLAAMEAPSLMREKTPAESDTVCSWYKGLVSDPRPLVMMRAAGYLIMCGPRYIEQLLAADDALLKDKKLTKMQLRQYSQVCAPVISPNGPTPEQCTRLKGLLVSVLEDKRFDVFTRLDAITLLTANFAGKDTLALNKKYASDPQPLLAEQAKAGVKQITDALATAASDQPPPKGANEVKPASKRE